MPKDKFNTEHIFTEELIHRLKEAESKVKEYEKEINKLKKSQQKQSSTKKKSKVILIDDNVTSILSIF